MLGSFILASEVHGGFGWHETVLLSSSLIVIATILATAFVARAQAGLVPKGLAAVYEHIFDWLEGLAASFMPRESRTYVPLGMSFFLYILISNWLGMIPLPVWTEKGEEFPLFESPTISISTTLALAVLAVTAFNLFGLKKYLFGSNVEATQEHGDPLEDGHSQEHRGAPGLWAWIRRFWEPVETVYGDLAGPLKMMALPLFFLFLLLNTVDRFLPLVSLSLRLYGNISAKHIVKVSLVSIMEGMIHQGDLFSWVLAAILFGATCFVALLAALAGFLQAMIFTVLLLSYIGHAVATEH